MPLRSARNLLSLLPSELVSALPDLQATIHDIATDAQLASHGTSSTRSRAARKSRAEDSGHAADGHGGKGQGEDDEDDVKSGTSSRGGSRFGGGEGFQSKGSHFNFDVAIPSRAQTDADYDRTGSVGDGGASDAKRGFRDSSRSTDVTSQRKGRRPSQVTPETS